MLFVFRNVLKRSNPVGRKARAHFRHGGPRLRVQERDLAERGVDWVVGSRGRRPSTAPAARQRPRRSTSETVVWCTGLPSGVRLGRAAGVRRRRMAASSTAGWPTACPACSSAASSSSTPRSSMIIHGAGRDAAHVAGRIARATRSRSPRTPVESMSEPRDRATAGTAASGDRHARTLRRGGCHGRRQLTSSRAGRPTSSGPGPRRTSACARSIPTWPPKTWGASPPRPTWSATATRPTEPWRSPSTGTSTRANHWPRSATRSGWPTSTPRTAVPPSAPAGSDGRCGSWSRCPRTTVEHGYLRVHEMMRHVFAGEFPVAFRLAAEIVETGQRWHDGDLTAMGLSSSRPAAAARR